jgi:hypothetical protein
MSPHINLRAHDFFAVELYDRPKTPFVSFKALILKKPTYTLTPRMRVPTQTAETLDVIPIKHQQLAKLVTNNLYASNPICDLSDLDLSVN